MINLSGNSISTVWRENGFVYKRQMKFLCENEFWCLNRLINSGYTPQAWRIDDETIQMEDLGESQKVTDMSCLTNHLKPILDALSLASIRHGDLTEKNIIVKENKPYIIDFSESRLWDDPRPDKRPEGDAFWLRKTISELCAKM